MNLHQLSWDDLRIFLAVARLGNLSKAGRQLGIDHSTVGRRVSALEYVLGTPLFERDRMGYRLNASGRAMLGHVEAIEAGVLILGDAFETGDLGPTGNVRFATMEGIASLYLSEQFVTFRQMRPGITVELVTSAHHVEISQREADIFLGFFEPRGRDLDARKIGEFGLHLYASRAYREQHGVPVSVTDLDAHHFVGYIPDLIELDAVRWLEEGIAQPNIVFRSSSMLSQMFSAVAGGGIVMLPDFARPARFGLEPVLFDEINVRREMWISIHRYLLRVPRIKAAVDFVTEVIGRDHPA
jgi:DNA-binding transcriptional LysR family regulator